MHGMPEAEARTQLEVARLERAFEQQDRTAPAERANPLGLRQVQQRKAIGRAQAFERAFDAVPVGVGLDHRPGARVGRGGHRASKVVAQGAGMYGGKDRTGHT